MLRRTFRRLVLKEFAQIHGNVSQLSDGETKVVLVKEAAHQEGISGGANRRRPFPCDLHKGVTWKANSSA